MPTFRPGKPAWILSQQANQSFPAGAVQDVAWDDLIHFEDVQLLGGGTEVWVDRPGLYLVGVQVTRNATATASPVTVRLRQAGVTLLLNQTVSSANAMTAPLTRLIHMNDVEPLVVNATLHTLLAATTAAPSTEFWGVRVGPVRWVG